MKFKIRKFRKEDAKEVSQIVKNCFLKLDIGGHTKSGIQLQIELNRPGSLVKRSENITYYVALDDGKIIGVCGYDNYKVHTLFVDIAYQKKGVGKELLSKVLHEAEKDGLEKIVAWSTFYARKFYESFGFTKIKNIYLPEGKKDMVLIEMEKSF
ncbi:MAG: GNAT family N-acetyltransferase [Candidatus Aenigmarchaeota archaeon]|nr:GNAT family N-acetyltransferase [Candidatus Aenigmarchaeota archaeon]